MDRHSLRLEARGRVGIFKGVVQAGTNISWPDEFVRDYAMIAERVTFIVLGLACRQASEDQLADTAAPYHGFAIHRPGAESRKAARAICS